MWKSSPETLINTLPEDLTPFMTQRKMMNQESMKQSNSCHLTTPRSPKTASPSGFSDSTYFLNQPIFLFPLLSHHEIMMNQMNSEDQKKKRRKEWLLPVLLGCGLEGNVDAIDVIEDLIADPRPVVVERFIVDVVVSAGFIGLDASAETVFIGTPPLLATAPRQLGRHGSGRVKYRVGFQVTNYASVTTLIGVRAKIAHIFGAGLPMITL